MGQSGQNRDPEIGATPVRSGKIKWIIVILLLLFAAVAAMNLPRGYSDDLSRIGKGHPVVVIVRDKDSVPSFDLIHVLDGLRGKYDGKVEFLLTEFNTPEGRAFIAVNHAAPATLVLIDAGGKTVKVLNAPQTAENVRQEIANALGVTP